MRFLTERRFLAPEVAQAAALYPVGTGGPEEAYESHDEEDNVMEEGEDEAEEEEGEDEEGEGEEFEEDEEAKDEGNEDDAQ